MITVFLVEDEFIVRQGIKNNIDWAGNGYEFVGDAGDGERAYHMIMKCRPDIVITDIRMPFMDGLELSRLVKARLPGTEIIILSGYADFEYAQEAIRIGVSRYISKPINGEDLLREVGVLADQIREARKAEAPGQRDEEDRGAALALRRRNLFHRLILGKRPMQELLEQGMALSIDLSAAWYNLLLFIPRFPESTEIELDIYRQPGDRAGEDRLKDFEKIKEMMLAAEQPGIVVFDRALEGIAILVMADTKEELEERQRAVIDSAVRVMDHFPGMRYFGGIGERVERLSELPRSFEKARQVFSGRHMYKESIFLDSSRDPMRSVSAAWDDFFEIDTRTIRRDGIEMLLKQGEREEARYLIEEYIHRIGRKSAESVFFRQYIIMDLYFCVREFVESLGDEEKRLTPPDILHLMQQPLDDTVEYLTRLLETAIDRRDHLVSDRHRDVVSAVKAYIREHYGDEELSLNEVAAHVNFSPNHLSAVFGQATGQTFIRYLTDVRMNKAKELLRCTRSRSSEICTMVGYKDPHYFSFLFKKHTGLTPTQYREGRSPEDNDAEAKGADV